MGSFWWRDVLKLLPDFKSIATPHVENGESIFFWHDNWGNQSLVVEAPELFSYAKNKSISVQRAFSIDDFSSLFQLPLSQAVFLQMQDIQQLIVNRPLSYNNDRWAYSWGSNNFASTKVYKLLMGHSEIHPAFKLLWKSQCQPKHKVFFWLLISDRLSTRNILRRRHMLLDSYSCVLCNSLVEESVDHLFADCSFARMCWDFIHIDIPLDSGFPELTS